MSVQSNKYITPVENSTLVHAISNTLNAKMQHDHHLTWRCVCTILHSTGNQTLNDELQPFIDDVERQAAMIRGRRGYTVADTYNSQRKVDQLYRVKSDELYKKVMQALAAHGYLVKMPPDIPRNF